VEGPLCPPGTRLIETLLWDGRVLPRIDRHLLRLEASARALGFRYPGAAVRAALSDLPGGTALRVRLTLTQTGEVEVTTAPLAATTAPWRIVVAKERLRSDDPFLRHKTTERALYDRVRAALPAGLDEAIFLNERGEVCEGTITTVFFDLGQGLATPPLSVGCLPGVLRAEMIATGAARQAVLRAEDLPRARLWVGNALRGLIPARPG
jgi:4-amino-4-deoxychorismate lyase